MKTFRSMKYAVLRLNAVKERYVLAAGISLCLMRMTDCVHAVQLY